ncbi:hypothetical protein [Dyella sp. EPa41]|uniref:hypothetical protein n=1 Tax=Dyella sp. EPa41 TaxID=1561194 RepID=UPI001915D790|nr:hypothetical protein [Dyella sp. EPa41]
MPFGINKLIFAMLAVSISLSGCTKGDEVTRIHSPDRSLDVVVIEDSAGATSDFWYEVCVVPAKQVSCDQNNAAAILYGATRSDVSNGVNAYWDDNDHVVMTYKTAKRISKQKQVIHAAGREIRIKMQAGVEDPNAPPGSMWRAPRPSDHAHAQ